MIALKIIGSGSLYFAVHFRIWQSNASTLTPVCFATRPVLSVSVHVPPPLSPVVPPSLFDCDPPPHATVKRSNDRARILRDYLELAV